MSTIRNTEEDAQPSESETAPETGFLNTVNGNVSTSSLIPIALEEALRALKIPESWVYCDVREHKFSGLEIQLNVSHWSDALALYAPAIEKEIRSRLEWYQPTANQTRQAFAWRYLPQCGHPYSQIPDDTVWENTREKSSDPVMDSLMDSRGNIRLG